jgi:glycosyltransferase involved in cell wall biosynthesis
MLDQHRIAVVIPAYREARLIGRTIRGVPSYVDAIFVVDDQSDDATAQVAQAEDDPRVVVLRHLRNRGVGAAIVSGYRAAASAHHDVIAVMAGDNQMHPDDLHAVLEPVLSGAADYVKGNRFVHPEVRRMPLQRRLGGRLLSWATRRATGLDVGDCQCGFTAIARSAVERLPLDTLWPRFGYPNDLLGMLAERQMRVREVPVRPVYADETSGIRAFHVLTILGIIARRRLGMATSHHPA